MPKLIDMTGKKVGRWTVLEYDKNFRKNGGTGGAAWICRCDCGTIKSIRGTELRQGRTKSCGCLQKKDYTGQKFGKLTALCKDPNNNQKYICRCECGNTISVWVGHLIQGSTTSCHTGVCTLRNMDSLVGQKFGKLTVIKRDTTKLNNVYWICKCDCGTEKTILGDHLKRSNITSCGCDNQSRGEKKIKELLASQNIPFIQEYSFVDFYYSDTNKHPRYDFFVNNQYLIEFDGRQHFQINTWNKTDKDLKKAQKKDALKNQYALEHNIPLIRIPYYKMQRLEIKDLLPETSCFLVTESEVM